MKNSALILQISQFAASASVPSGQKETPAPINRERLRKKFPRHTLRIKGAHADESSKSLSVDKPVEFDGLEQILIPANSRELKRRPFSIHHLLFTVGANLEGLGYDEK